MTKNTASKQNHAEDLNNGINQALLHNYDCTNKKEATESEKSKDKKKNKSTWSGLAKKIKTLWPYIWPSGKPQLQLIVVVSMSIVFITRGINVLVPVFYKKIINSLTPVVVTTLNGLSQDSNNSSPQDNNAHITTQMPSTTTQTSTPPGVEFCWEYILVYILLKSLHGTSGYLNCLRSFLWIRVAQNTQKQMRLHLFSKLHSLSVQWHVTRKTGEVIRVMDRGVQSINLILSHVLFNIFPVIVDIIIAIVFFVFIFNIWTGLIIFTTMVAYLIFTITITEWRTKFRRKMNDSDNQRNAASVDSILNFETVKYYCAEDWEVKRYEENVDKHQHAEFYVNATWNVLNSVQKTMMMLGLLGGSLLCAWYVYIGEFTVGDYVLYGTYIEQLYVPLNMFGAYYRVLQQAFVDMEHMLEMLSEEESVMDQPHAGMLYVPKGEIKFENVWFEYIEKKPILKGVSFTVPPGETYALVGPSGGGKSTLVKLLFRFYDVTSGTIKIDNTDISKVTMRSLRQHIGVVPQDTVLFNQDIRFNIRYGKAEATDKDVEEAAKAADIHDKILDLYDGYESKVGERGLKLSGGEKQRVAIARTILKGPEIVLLDEATSALDTTTERNIQHSLKRLCENKTTIIVAHRLSTITHANKILVVKDGVIVESGTDLELRRLGGHYATMWQEQLQSGEIEDKLEDDVKFSLDKQDHNFEGYQVVDETLPIYTPIPDNNEDPVRGTGTLEYAKVDKQNKQQKAPPDCSNSQCPYPHHLNHTDSISDDEIEVPLKLYPDDVSIQTDINIDKPEPGESKGEISQCNHIPKRPLYQRMVSVPAKMPHSNSYTDSDSYFQKLPSLARQRSLTQGSANSVLAKNVLGKKARERQLREQNEAKEEMKQRERERLDTLRQDEETILNILAEDLSTIENVQYNDELIGPLCSSFNVARKVDSEPHNIERRKSKSELAINLCQTYTV